jgi:sugar phosphate isomerase/epimerase
MADNKLTQAVRIGTLAGGGQGTPEYMRKLLPYGFESFSINFWKTIGDVDLKRFAAEAREVCGDKAVISSVCVYGNPLETDAEGLQTAKDFHTLVEHAHLFGASIVAGFAGRVRNKSVVDSMPRFKEVFTPIVKKAADKGIRIAFENCPMGGNRETGDWNIAFQPAVWESMFNEIPLDNIGLQWEPCHQMCQLIDPLPQLRKWVKKVFHVHGKCATIRHDVIREHGIMGGVPWSFHRTPGFGDANWTDIISELRMGGFVGSIDIEGWHDPVYCGDLEITGQVRGLNYLKDCRGGDLIVL